MNDPAKTFVGEAWTMRAPCRFGCASTAGTITTVNGQDCVSCATCGRLNYNAPKDETGRGARTVTDEREPFKPSVRVAIIQRDGGRCQLCGRRENLHIGHCLSVKDGKALGLTDAEINDPLNLVTLCDACNLGMGASPLAPKIYALLLTKWTRRAA